MNTEDKLKYIYNWDNFISLIKEGLISTYPIKTTIKLITRELSDLKIIAECDSEESTNTIFIKGYSYSFLDKDIKILIRAINTCGYFPSTFEFYDKTDKLINTLVYKNIDDEFLKELNDNIKDSYYTQFTIESKKVNHWYLVKKY